MTWWQDALITVGGIAVVYGAAIGWCLWYAARAGRLMDRDGGEG